MSDKTNHTEPLFDNQLSKMKYPNRSMFDLIHHSIKPTESAQAMLVPTPGLEPGTP